MTSDPEARATLVVGFTPTGPGRAAVREAIAEARRRDAFVHVVNASRGDAYVDHTLAGADQLSELERLLTEAGVPHRVVQHVGRGEPAEEVLRAAGETGAALVVIGVRRRTPVGKFLLGSTAQRILLEAACPVLAVKEAETGRDGDRTATGRPAGGR